jgi:pyruvate dehydrogenase E2 component (dihydrolipoamide acetyltransferase)
MAEILRMPEVLANATEAVLASWLIAEGASFSTGDIIAELETEKALVELAAEKPGILGRQLMAPGESTAVGDPIAVVISEGESAAEIDAILGAETAQAASASSPASEPQAAGSVDHRAVNREPVDDRPADDRPSDDGPAGDGSRIFMSPLVRRLARERGIPLATVTGSGPGGRIVRRDLDDFLASPPEPTAAQASAPASAPTSAPAAAARSAAGTTEIPHTPMRKAIARRLTESKSTVPHFYLSTECRVDALLALRKEINETVPVKVSLNDLVVKAAAGAFLDVPDANVTWTDDAMIRYGSMDIAVAVATDGGLLTPVVRDAAARDLISVSRDIAELVERARAGRLRQSDLEGGSFSVTNLGMYGTTEFSAILNPPQSGILAVGAAQQQAVVTNGELSVATIMKCTLSVDHRAVDGALAAQWLAAFTRRVEHPVSILLPH